MVANCIMSPVLEHESNKIRTPGFSLSFEVEKHMMLSRQVPWLSKGCTLELVREGSGRGMLPREIKTQTPRNAFSCIPGKKILLLSLLIIYPIILEKNGTVFTENSSIPLQEAQEAGNLLKVLPVFILDSNRPSTATVCFLYTGVQCKVASLPGSKGSTNLVFHGL